MIARRRRADAERGTGDALLQTRRSSVDVPRLLAIGAIYGLLAIRDLRKVALSLRGCFA